MFVGTNVWKSSQGDFDVLCLAYLFCSVWMDFGQLNTSKQVGAAILINQEFKVSRLELLDYYILSKKLLELLGLL